MEYIVLGLLLLQSRTIYQLRERIHKGIHLMYSSSMGSIQAAVRKLLDGGSIEYKEMVDHGKYKKIYAITERGKQRFFQWVNAPMEEQAPKSPELAKVYFMGFSDESNREASIREHLLFLKEQYAALEAICGEAEHAEVPEEHREIFNYQLVSALYGRDLLEFNINWFENLLGKIGRGEI